MSQEQWLKQVQETSKLYNDFFCRQESDDAIGWERLLKELLQYQETQRDYGFVITGPEGCGSHTILSETLFLIQKETDCETIFLTGEQLSDGVETQQEACTRLEMLLEHFQQKNELVCLVLERLEETPFRAALLRVLERQICRIENEKAKKDSDWSFFLILMQEENASLPPVLRSRLQVCRVQYPKRFRRRVFFENQLEELYYIFPKEQQEQLLDQTDGFSYQQMSNLAGLLRAALRASNQDPLTDELLEELIDGQRLKKPEAVEKAAFWTTVEQTLKNLPDLLQKLPQNIVGVPMQSAQPEMQVQKTDAGSNDYEMQMQTELEKVKQKNGAEFLTGLFGEEGVQKILTSE